MPRYQDTSAFFVFAKLVGQRVLLLRKARKRTRATIAYMVGISVKSLVRIETGVKCMSLETAARLAVALRVSISDLVGEPLDERKPAVKKRGRAVRENGRVYRKGMGRTAVYDRLAKARGYTLARGENLKAINEARRAQKAEKLSPTKSQKIVISESQANGIRIPPVKRRKRKKTRRVPPKAVGVPQ